MQIVPAASALRRTAVSQAAWIGRRQAGLTLRLGSFSLQISTHAPFVFGLDAPF